MVEKNPSQAFSVVLHDVAPTTWPSYADFIMQMEAHLQVALPLTLLLVPDFHHQGRFDADAAFVAAMQARLQQGDELVLHGYYHQEYAVPPPTRPLAWFMRRIYTVEGEFYALDTVAAKRRIELGLNLFQQLAWPVSGFVAPAWLLSQGTLTALQHLPVQYTSSRTQLIHLTAAKVLAAPSLVWSARSRWRRLSSALWNAYLLKHYANVPYLRLGLHPIDLQYESIRVFWLNTIQRLAATRQAMTKATWLQQVAA